MQIQCPSCSKAIKAPDEKAGSVVTCPSCEGQMQLPAADAATPAPAPAETKEEGRETRVCPQCGETVLAVARKCKHCRSILLAPGKRFKGRKRKRNTRGEGRSSIVFGIISLVLLPIPFIAMVVAGIAILYGNSARKNPQDRKQGIAGMCLGGATLLVVVAMLVTLIVLIAARGG